MTLSAESLIPCRSAIQDVNTLNVTLVDCLEQVDALAFPAMHHGFALASRLVWRGEPPSETLAFEYRLVRFSDIDAEEVIFAGKMAWQAHTTRGRILCGFPAVRLRRPEVLHFRLDVREPDQAWRPLAGCSIDVHLADMPEEDRDALLERFRKQHADEVERHAREAEARTRR